MLARIKTSTLTGIDAIAVEVEAEVREGRPSFSIIGLADSAVRESRERVLSAIKHSGFIIPEQILINLAPAELKKEGAAFDLPIAIAILCASGQLSIEDSRSIVFHGELALDGRLKPVRGSLAIASEARQRGIPVMIMPAPNANEAALIADVKVFAAQSLQEVAMHFRGQGLQMAKPAERTPSLSATRRLAEVWGQESAKRALLIAAAGGHNMIMVGPPGCGKSMLAERFPSILPPLMEEEMLEVIRIHSVAGLDTQALLAGRRPFRNPHHGISEAGLIGGGSSPRPGEISLAHHGVLFLDEFPEFRRASLEALRAPLESGIVQISRAKGTLRLPARFQLLAAMNPCPCGRLGSDLSTCTCSRPAIIGYLRKLSQPILDRIDLHVELAPVILAHVNSTSECEITKVEQGYKSLVLRAREIQLQRQGYANALLPGQVLNEKVLLSSPVRQMLEQACARRGLSARSYVRILRVARTIADIEGIDSIESRHIAEALSYRCLETIERYCAAA